MMKVHAKELDWKDVPQEVRPFISQAQTFITPGREYVVHAVSVYKKLTFFLVVDDLETPAFLPSWAFAVTSKEIPTDWICSADLGSEVDLVLGPKFIAGDLEAYVGMIDQETELLDLFWRYCSTGSPPKK